MLVSVVHYCSSTAILVDGDSCGNVLVGDVCFEFSGVFSGEDSGETI